MNGEMSEEYHRYVLDLETELARIYSVSDHSREKGLDPSLRTECKIAKDLAELVEGLVGPKGVAESIRELSNKLPREELAFKVAEQVVYGKFGHMEPEPAAEQSIRTALAILTEGLTAAPLQGIAKAKIKPNNDRTKYLAVYFAGPMRSAGGTDQALTLVVADFIRRLLGLDRYKPTEEEISRFIEELRLYQRSVTRFQYHVSDGELRRALQWIPVEVTGPESDPFEVSSFRNVPRIETNRVRGGALRVVNDGIIGRAPKVLAIVEKLGIQGWDWLKEFHKKSEKKSAGFMDDVIAGRPIFSFPSRRGGFRLRYGRARNTGLAAVGVNPLTMKVLRNFLAGGTQVRLELPGKGGVVVPVDSIEPPIVKLVDGSVKRVTKDNFAGIEGKIQKILFLGDLLISFGDFLYNSKDLGPSGYVEEWWSQDLAKAIADKSAKTLGISQERLLSFIEMPFECKPSLNEALLLSRECHMPLHPVFTLFWSNLTSTTDLELLRTWLRRSKIEDHEGVTSRITGKNEPSIKKILEDLCASHSVVEDLIIIDGEEAGAFAFCLGYPNFEESNKYVPKTPLEGVCMFSGIQVRDKAPTLVGARMGRPEKAKRREMKPLVHVLFPVGLAGGSHRNIVEAAKREPIFIDAVKRKCPSCGTFTFRVKCPSCGSETVLERFCPRCGKPLKTDGCPSCKIPSVSYQKQPVNFREAIDKACNSVGVSKVKILRGVKGLTNETKTPEPIEKGVLRARNDLSVYKDGTIRFDSTNAPLTHFKPSEIGVSIERLKQLGYVHDADGLPLIDVAQICELKLQDIVIPSACMSYLWRVANFLDELLVRFYGLEPYYNLKEPKDIVGQLVVGLAPHTCAGTLGRVIGFTSLNLCYAHPIWHSAKRRDCDGDEDAVMLALDTLVNFSREYLPAQIGGIMDAPLLLIPIINPDAVQRQAHDFDVAKTYPIEFYEKTQERLTSRRVSDFVDLVGYRLGTSAQYECFGYTTPVSDVNMGNSESSYKRVKTMIEKLNGQLELAERIEAVDAKKVALKVLTTHFIKDIAGNMRAFSTQAFRCKSCNKRFRRVPLRGKCPFCGGKLSLTVYRGGIQKYLEAAQHLVEKYSLPNYYAQRIELAKSEICSMFDGKKPKQALLADFA